MSLLFYFDQDKDKFFLQIFLYIKQILVSLHIISFWPSERSIVHLNTWSYSNDYSALCSLLQENSETISVRCCSFIVIYL